MERSILERYFNNTCSPEEREKVLAWLSDEQHSEEVKNQLSMLWGNFDDAKWADTDEQMPDYAQIRAAIPELAVNRQSPVKQMERQRNGGIGWYVAAACVGFVLAIGVMFWRNRETTGEADYVIVQTEKGERKWVTLSDGSKVYLNADSRLVYPKEMELHQAAIYIEGEAFFNMTESDKPRIIKAGGVETLANAGSAKFNITAFPADSVVTVAVDDGKAEIRSEYGPLLKLRIPEQSRQDSVLPLTKLRPPKTMPMLKLRPAVQMERREFAVVHKERGDVDVSGALDERKVFGWKDGILYFEDANANEIARTLERWYGVKVNFCEDGQPTDTYSAEFNNAQLPSVLSQLSRSLQLHYTQKGNEVYLCSK